MRPVGGGLQRRDELGVAGLRRGQQGLDGLGADRERGRDLGRRPEPGDDRTQLVDIRAPEVHRSVRLQRGRRGELRHQRDAEVGGVVTDLRAAR